MIFKYRIVRAKKGGDTDLRMIYLLENFIDVHTLYFVSVFFINIIRNLHCPSKRWMSFFFKKRSIDCINNMIFFHESSKTKKKENKETKERKNEIIARENCYSSEVHH